MGSAQRQIPNVRCLRGAAHGTARTFRAAFIFARRQASVEVETQLRAVRLLTISLNSISTMFRALLIVIPQPISIEIG